MIALLAASTPAWRWTFAVFTRFPAKRRRTSASAQPSCSESIPEPASTVKNPAAPGQPKPSSSAARCGGAGHRRRGASKWVAVSEWVDVELEASLGSRRLVHAPVVSASACASLARGSANGRGGDRIRIVPPTMLVPVTNRRTANPSPGACRAASGTPNGTLGSIQSVRRAMRCVQASSSSGARVSWAPAETTASRVHSGSPEIASSG